MEKRYQVFVSSTYGDLQEERRQVMHALLQMDCIPAGMELFPASDENAWSLIKRVIEQSDYYIVVVGGRYGSINLNGISYTEMEYQHAVNSHKPIVPFLHKDPEQIPLGRSESDPVIRKRLSDFRKTLEQTHTCKYWGKAEELCVLVSQALFHLMRTGSATGWVRGDTPAEEETLRGIERLRKESEKLKKRLQDFENKHSEEKALLAQGSDKILIEGEYGPDALYLLSMGKRETKAIPSGKISVRLTWDELVRVIGDAVDLGSKKIGEEEVSGLLSHLLGKKVKSAHRKNEKFTGVRIYNKQLRQIAIQLEALDIIRVKPSPSSLTSIWCLTQTGFRKYAMIVASKRQ